MKSLLRLIPPKKTHSRNFGLFDLSPKWQLCYRHPSQMRQSRNLRTENDITRLQISDLQSTQAAGRPT